MKQCKARETVVNRETEEVASATECTGLIPALPQDDAQAEASTALLGIRAAKDAQKHRDKR